MTEQSSLWRQQLEKDKETAQRNEKEKSQELQECKQQLKTAEEAKATAQRNEKEKSQELQVCKQQLKTAEEAKATAQRSQERIKDKLRDKKVELQDVKYEMSHITTQRDEYKKKMEELEVKIEEHREKIWQLVKELTADETELNIYRANCNICVSSKQEDSTGDRSLGEHISFHWSKISITDRCDSRL